MSAEMVVVELAERSSNSARCVVKCVRGTVSTGDFVRQARNDGRELQVDLEVVEISRYEGVLVQELEENFGALVQLVGLWPAEVDAGWSLRTEPAS